MKDTKGPATMEPEPELGELRTILLGIDPDMVLTLNDRVSNPASRATDVAEVLPEALARSSALPQALGVVARPMVEHAIEASVRRDPSLLGELLFPVMGPAIRRAVADAIQAFMRALNQGLEQSVSLRSFKWRFEAWRTGKSFGEVVLRHTLRFRVEQVFLIHRETGVLLHHVVQPAVEAADADVVSSMLYAIHDFVHDSFRVQSNSGLEQIDMGDLTIWIETGPRAIVAAVVRGTAPVEYRDALTKAVEAVHARYSGLLQHFNGETAPFQVAEPILSDCLFEELEDGAQPSLWRAYVATALVVAVLGAVGYWWYQDRSRWVRAVDTLRNEPGLVVVDAGYGWRRPRVSGLRDAYASDPTTLLGRAGFEAGTVVSEWRPFQSGDATIAERRAIDLLRPPAEVRMAVREGVLRVSGRAPGAWTQELQRLGRLIAGVEAIDTSELVDLDRLTLEEDRRQLSAFTIGFAAGTAELDGEALAGVTQYAARVADLARRAARMDTRLDIAIAGGADASGEAARNLALAQRRAATVASVLTTNGVPADWVRVEAQAPMSPPPGDVSAPAPAGRFATVTIQFADDGRRR